MKNDLPQEMFDLLYSKMQRLAREYANSKAEELPKNIGNESFCIFNPWAHLLTGFCYGRFSEEEVKYCFNLGFVPEDFEDPAFRPYKIRRLCSDAYGLPRWHSRAYSVTKL